MADPEDAALRARPTVQADFFFCEERSEETKYILLMVDTWTRYIHAEPLKVRNKRSVGEAMARFLGNLGYSENVEVAVDNEPVLVAGMEFCKEVRLRLGLSTVVTRNKNYDKSRTSTAERMIQTVRNLQKTLIHQLEDEIQCKIPVGHCLRYWATVHSAWLYNRFHIHSFLKVTPFQAVTGCKLANFGQLVMGFYPKSAGWRRNIYLAKDASGHDVVGTGEDEVTRTKALRRTANLWSAETALGLKIGPWDTTGYTQSQAKVQPLPPVLPQLMDGDRDAQDVLAYKGHSDEEAEEETKPEQFGSGGEQVQNLGEEVQQEVSMETEAIPTTAVPMDPGRIFDDNTLLSDLMPGAGGAASSASVERASKRPEEFEGATQPKAPRLDEPAVPEPKVKAARTDVRMVHNVEVAVSDEIGLGTSRHLTRVSLTSRQNYNVEKEKDHPRCPRST